MNRIRIRTAIATLVEERMEALGVESVHKLPDPAFDDPLCPLVNPLCPDDLCWLPAGHVGTKEGYHVLGTTPYDCAERYPKDWLVERLPDVETYPPRDKLIEAGQKLAREMGIA